MSKAVCRIEISSGGETRFIEVTKTTFILGRGEAADIKVTTSGVSRTHLSVEIKDSKINVKDLNSANGTRLSGKKLAPNQFVLYREGEALNLGLADDTFKIMLLASPTQEEVKLPPLPVLKSKPQKHEIPKIQHVELPKEPVRHKSPEKNQELPIIPRPQVKPPLFDDVKPISLAHIDRPPLESTVVDPEYRKMSKFQNNLANEEIMEEARAAALKLKIAAEAQAAKIVQEAKEKVLLEMSKAKDKAEAMVAEASDKAYKLQRKGEEEVAKMRQGMEESLNKLNEAFEERSEALLGEARIAATQTKAEAQKDADKIVSLAYQKAADIKNLAEAELKNISKDEKKKVEGLIGAAQMEADKILQETRSAATLLRKNLEREIEENKAQAMAEANVIRTEAMHEGEKEAAKTKLEAQRQADSLLERTRHQVESEEVKIKEMVQLATVEVTNIKAEAEKLAENLLSRSRDQIETEEQRIKELSHDTEIEAGKIKSEAQRQADSLLERAREQLGAEKEKTLELASEEAAKIKADATREAKKEALNLLKLAESDRSGLTQALEKLGQDLVQLEKKKVDLAAGNKGLQKRNLELQTEVEETKLKVTEVEAVFKAKTLELEGLNSEAKKVSETAGLAEEAIKGVREERKTLLKRIEAIKEDEEKLTKAFEAHLMQVEADKIRLKDTVASDVSAVREAAMAEVKVLRDKAKQDFESKKTEQTEELSKMRLTELSTIKGLRAEEEARFAAARKHHILEISKALETYVIPRIKESLNWAEIPKPLENFFVDVKDIVEKVIDGQFSSQVANTAMDISTSRPKKSVKKRNVMIVAGAALVAVAFISTIPMENEGKRKPASEVFLERLKQKEAQKPKFNPKLTDDYKDSYTDNVLYTRDYTDFKLNPDNQALWIKDLNKFFMNNLNLNENAIVSFISVEQSLVGQLKDLGAVVHIENQKEDIKKMTDVEKSSVTEMVSILGDQDKYKAFRQFEKDYFSKSRQPASQTQHSSP